MRPKFRINDKVIYKGNEYKVKGILKGTIVNRYSEIPKVVYEVNFNNTGFSEYYTSYNVPESVPEDISEFYQYDIGIRDAIPDGRIVIKTVKEENLVKEY